MHTPSTSLHELLLMACCLSVMTASASETFRKAAKGSGITAKARPGHLIRFIPALTMIIFSYPATWQDPCMETACRPPATHRLTPTCGCAPDTQPDSVEISRHNSQPVHTLTKAETCPCRAH